MRSFLVLAFIIGLIAVAAAFLPWDFTSHIHFFDGDIVTPGEPLSWPVKFLIGLIAGLIGILAAVVGVLLVGAILGGVVLFMIGVGIFVTVVVILALFPFAAPFILLGVILWLIFRRKPKPKSTAS